MSDGGHNGGPQSLFRIYRVTIRERLREESPAAVLEIQARTLGAARREAMQRFPSHVVLSVERVQ